MVFYNPGDGTPGWNTISGTALSSSNAICPTPTLNPTIPYVYNIASGMCERTVQDCPANSSGTYPDACVCNTGYKVDLAGTSCIPVSTCPIPDLPPITDPQVQAFEDNPDLSDTADLTSNMQTALQRLQAAVSAAGSTSSVGSAYRPPAYNQHLIDVWKKWMNELKKNSEPLCADLKSKIHRHFQRHKLKESQTPVPGSRHTRGEAVDVTINPDIPNIDTLARACCNLRRPVPVDDPVHFQFP